MSFKSKHSSRFYSAQASSLRGQKLLPLILSSHTVRNVVITGEWTLPMYGPIFAGSQRLVSEGEAIMRSVVDAVFIYVVSYY